MGVRNSASGTFVARDEILFGRRSVFTYLPKNFTLQTRERITYFYDTNFRPKIFFLVAINSL